MQLTKYVPKLADWRNEVVFYLGLGATTVLGVQQIIEGVEVDSVDSWMAAVPLVLGLFQRQFAYGPKTVERDYVPR